jgi:hypothetical protein
MISMIAQGGACSTSLLFTLPSALVQDKHHGRRHNDVGGRCARLRCTFHDTDARLHVCTAIHGVQKVPTYPTLSRSVFLAWCEEHAPTWENNAAAIGLAPAAAAAFKAQVIATSTAELAQGQAKQAAKARP